MAIFDELKSVASTLQEAGKIEQYRQILDAQKELLEMQKQIADITNENKELKEKLEIKESLVYKDNVYWIEKENKKDGPFCSCCWDNDKKTIRMQPCGNPVYFDCPKCKNKGVQIYPDALTHNEEPKNFDPYSAV